MSPKRRWWPAGLALALAAACGGPPGLDADEGAVSARTCAGLLVRAAEAAGRVGWSTRIELDGVEVDPVSDPAGFVRRFGSVRAERFSGEDPLADRSSSATALVARCRRGGADDGG